MKHTTQTKGPISDDDFRSIESMVHGLCDVASIEQMSKHLELMFGDSITPGHYIVFGYLCGDLASEKTDVNNLTNYNLSNRKN